MRDLRWATSVELRVLRFVSEWELLSRHERCLLLLSGGADSMAMLRLVSLCGRRMQLGLHLAALHIDYGLRGAASDRDRVLVERACTTAGVELTVRRAPPSVAGPGMQVRARDLRYQVAHELAREHRYTRILTAHNRDDQAETVLYRLVKYASPTALEGMPVRDAEVARPLLCLSAAEVREYCAVCGIAYGEDASNARPIYARNILRLQVLPELERINPRVTEGLAGAALLARGERELLDQLAADAWERVLASASGLAADAAGKAGGPVLDVAALQTEHPALRAACLRRFLRAVPGGRLLGDRRRVAAIERLVVGRGSGRVSLPGGWEAVRERDRVYLRPTGKHVCAPIAIEWPGSGVAMAEFCGARYRLALEPGARFQHTEAEAWIGLGTAPRLVTLRHPQRGERFAPFGAEGSTTVLQFLADRRAPRAARERALVVAVDGAVAWVGGRVAEAFRVSESTAMTLHIRREGR